MTIHIWAGTLTLDYTPLPMGKHFTMKNFDHRFKNFAHRKKIDDGLQVSP